MAHHLSAKKRIRTNAKANLRNRSYRSLMRSTLRKVGEPASVEARQEHLRLAVSVLDKLATKGIIHRNTAARRKSKLFRQIARMATVA